jgi:16S rRNA (cytidine1402-2'-O)-methyltransferase
MTVGFLSLVATPIGHLKDITLRALETLQTCDIIVCEDTRVSQKLLQAYHIRKPLLTYHDHNAEKMRPRLVEKLKKGAHLALITDAGTPLVSDPGYKLVQACYENGIPFTALPGPSAILPALLLSGYPPYPFSFYGFVDTKEMPSLQEDPKTLIIFESPHRLVKTLEKMCIVFPHRAGCVIREISKRYESVQRGSFEALFEFYQNTPPKGEIVIVIAPRSIQSAPSQEAIDHALETALRGYHLKEACALVADALGLAKRVVYQRALQIRKNKDKP